MARVQGFAEPCNCLQRMQKADLDRFIEGAHDDFLPTRGQLLLDPVRRLAVVLLENRSDFVTQALTPDIRVDLGALILISRLAELAEFGREASPERTKKVLIKPSLDCFEEARIGFGYAEQIAKRLGQ